MSMHQTVHHQQHQQQGGQKWLAGAGSPLNPMSNWWLCSKLSTTSHSHSQVVGDGRKIITLVSVQVDRLCGMHMLCMMFLQLSTDSWYMWSFPHHCWDWLWSGVHSQLKYCMFSVFIQSLVQVTLLFDRFSVEQTSLKTLQSKATLS